LVCFSLIDSQQIEAPISFNNHYNLTEPDTRLLAIKFTYICWFLRDYSLQYHKCHVCIKSGWIGGGGEGKLTLPVDTSCVLSHSVTIGGQVCFYRWYFVRPVKLWKALIRWHGVLNCSECWLWCLVWSITTIAVFLAFWTVFECGYYVY